MRRRLLSVEIAALLGAKLLALTALYYAFFVPPPQPSAGTVASRLLDPDRP